MPLHLNVGDDHIGNDAACLTAISKASQGAAQYFTVDFIAVHARNLHAEGILRHSDRTVEITCPTPINQVFRSRLSQLQYKIDPHIIWRLPKLRVLLFVR